MVRKGKLGWVIGSLLLAGVIGIPQMVKGAEGDLYEMLNLFGDVYERVRTEYVEPVEDQKLIESAINGMLTSLDPHSSYLNEKNFKEMQVQTKGEFGGLGIEVTMDNGLVKVVSPIDDTPAFQAGVKAGDLITQIDGEAVMGLTLSEAVEKMRGPVGTKITITIMREGESEPMDITITRDIIKIKSVRTRREGDIAYLRITSFSERTFELLKGEWDRLKKEIGDVKGIVLDLRNNPGGLLDQAIEVSDAFLDQGEIVSTRGRDPSNTNRFDAEPGDMAEGIPMVVLINAGSASASEIVAGALKDHKRAVIVGTQSFGKGSVQTVIPLPGHGAMRLTTSRYYTPSGHSIQAKGIEPDIVVEQAKIEPLKKTYGPRYEADLRGALINEEGKKEPRPSKPVEPKDEDDADEKDEKGDKDQKKPDGDTKTDGEISASEDFQLARALDLLRALSVYNKQNGAASSQP